MGFQRTGVLPILLDLSRYDHPTNPDLLRGHAGKTVLLHVGRIAPNKRIEDLLKILTFLRRLDPKAHLLVVGTEIDMEAYAGALRRLARQLDLGDHITFAGPVRAEDLPTYYRLAACYVTMSEHEGFCVPLLEAMHLGCPVVAYAAAAVPETLGGAGLLFHEKDHPVIAEAIHHLVTTPALREAIVRGQRERVRAFSPEAVAARFKTALAEVLVRRDPLALGVNAGDRYTQIARQLISYRDREARGVLQNFDQLQAVQATPAVMAALRENFYNSSFAVVNVEIVGPKVGADLRRQAVLVTLYALGGMLIYIAFRFEWVYGAAAVLAVFHDVLITLGLFSLLGFEVSLTVIAALLTLVGYSMNDTIVIFDRIRENLRLMRREPFAVIVNRSINQTLSRTILTSGLTFLTVLVLFLMGGQVLRSFSFALVVGILIGTYSSFGIAAPLVVAWNNWRGASAGPVSGTVTGTKSRGGESQTRLATAGRR